MRPLKLSIKGLNSFIEEQVIDFERLTDKGLFGIFGPTGSGKSTILDGITLALYGKIARGSTEYINKNTDQARVVFTFRLTSDRIRCYRVEREIKRNAAGEVRTSYARITEVLSEGETILEDKVSGVNRRCEEIIGLNADDFSRTVVLPQGKFSEFLKLQNAPRREMLERIFNLEQYGVTLSKKIARQVQRCRDEQNELSGQLKGYEGVNADAEKDIREALKASEAALEEAGKDALRVQAAFDTASQLWQLQGELEAALKAQEKHLENHGLDLQRQEQIRLAELAQRLEPYWTAQEEAAASVKAAEKQLDSLRREEAVTREAHQKKAQELLEIRDAREKEMPLLRIREAELTKAVKEKQTLAALKELVEGIRLEAGSLRERLAAQEKLEKALQQEQKELEQSVQLGEKAMEALRIPETHKKQVREALTQANKLQHTRETLGRNQAREAAVAEGIRKSQEAWEKIGAVAAAAASRRDEADEKRQQLAAAVPGSPEDLVRLGVQAEDVRAKWERYRLLNGELALAEAEMAERVARLDALGALKSEAEGHLVQLTEAYESRQQDELAAQLRQKLRSGEACPVCGSLDHPAGHEALAVSGSLAALRQEREEAAGALRELERQVTEATTALNHLSDKQETAQAALRELGTEFLRQDEAALRQQLEQLKQDIASHALAFESAEKAVAEARESLTQAEKEQTLLHGALEADRRQQTQLKAEGETLLLQLQAEEEQLAALMLPLGSMDLETRNQEISEAELQAEKAAEALVQEREALRRVQEQLKLEGEQLRGIREELIQKETTLQGHEETLHTRAEALFQLAGPPEGIEKALGEAGQRLEALQKGFEAAEAAERLLAESLRSQCDALVACESALKLHGQKEAQALRELTTKLTETGFKEVQEAKDCRMERVALELLVGEVKAFNTLTDTLAGGIRQIMSQLDGRSLQAAEWERVQLEKQQTSEAVLRLTEQKAALQHTYLQMQADLAALQGLILQKQAIDTRLGHLNDLAKLFEARKFVGYIAATQLHYIAGKASEQLMAITSGSYALEADPDGDFIIRDYRNGGQTREPATLSGGETFLVSLALALALSAQIQLKGAAPLELFFLDEGFGTLDDDVLDVVMNALENMHHEKLTIGLISHVEAIKSRVPAKLLVRPARSGEGGSTVRFELS